MAAAAERTAGGLVLTLQCAAADSDIPAQADLERWASATLRSGLEAEITVRIVDEDESGALNRRYRGKSGPTNVLSFAYDIEPELGLPLLGDLVVCAPVVRREAREQGKGPDAHWAHMIVHGMLHLQGFDHEREEDARVMETLESEIITRLGYDNPYG